jgi:hypothetical protein
MTAARVCERQKLLLVLGITATIRLIHSGASLNEEILVAMMFYPEIDYTRLLPTVGSSVLFHKEVAEQVRNKGNNSII